MKICCDFRRNNKNEAEKIKEKNKDLDIYIDDKLDLISSIILEIISKKQIKNINDISENIVNYQIEKKITNNIIKKNNKENCISKYDFLICEKCQKFYFNKILQPTDIKKVEIKEKEKYFTLEDIISKTKEKIIGQDHLIEELSSIMYFHYLKTKGFIKSDKSVIPLIIGLTGSGKTFTVKTISKIIDVPFICIPVTSFTGDGWSGNNIQEFFEQHFKKKNFNYSIVFIDEFDKVLNSSDDTKFEDLKQYKLLSFIEGEDFSESYSDMALKTDNMQFIFGGSFQQFLNQKNKNTIGFKAEVNSIKNNYKENLTKADLIKYGVKPELASRITNIIQTNRLSVDDYINILKHSNDSYLTYYKEIFKAHNVAVEFKPEFYENIASQAYNDQSGIRSLNTHLFKNLNPVISYISNNYSLKAKDTLTVISLDNDTNNFLTQEKKRDNKIKNEKY
tara:strand:+ start:4069 stop:5415 length:1347 start_codon:yes stop_codon:yes gene_type:complete